MDRGALRHGPFRLLFVRTVISSLGDAVVPVALAFAVLDLTGSATDLGIVLAAQTVPLMVFVLLGGVWADRLPRQYVVLGADVVRAASQGVSAALLVTGDARIWQLAVLQGVYGIARGFAGPALVPLVSQAVAPEDLQSANALFEMSRNAATVLGPALAGVLVAGIGAGWALVIDAASFAISVVLLAMVRLAPVTVPARTTMLSELRAGWKAFVSRSWLWITVAWFTVFIGFVYAPYAVLGPQIARTALGGVGAWAAISTASGVGAVAGGLVGMRWRPRHSLRFPFVVFLISGPPLYVLLAAHAPVAVLVVFAVIDGAAGTVFNLFWFTALQREVPHQELARVASWDYLGSLLLLPVGQVLAGPVSNAIGLSTTLYVTGGLFAVLVLVVLAVPAVRNFTTEPATA
jgi:MFS family permease